MLLVLMLALIISCSAMELSSNNLNGNNVSSLSIVNRIYSPHYRLGVHEHFLNKIHSMPQVYVK